MTVFAKFSSTENAARCKDTVEAEWKQRFGDLIQALNRRRQGMGGNLVGSKDEAPDANEFKLGSDIEVEHDSEEWDP